VYLKSDIRISISFKLIFVLNKRL